MITFFTSLKPFDGTTAIQQRNALRSWRSSVPDCEIIVFGEVSGDAGVLAEVNANYIPDIACNEFGTPLISEMFAEAQKVGAHSVVCYINGDIILLPDFPAALERLSKWKTFAAVGRRWDLDWDAPIDRWTEEWTKKIRALLESSGHQHAEVAHDYFAFRRGAIGSLPPFAIGRPAWDNYLIKYLLSHEVPIVDLSKVVKPIHQNHDYAHVAQRRGQAWDGPEADVNRKLAKDQFRNFNPAYYSIRNSQWLMLPRIIVPAVSPRRALWRALTLIPDPVRQVMESAVRLPRYAVALLMRFADLYAAIVPFSLLSRKHKSVAIVRTDNIGDFILWLDGARTIRAHYPRPDYHLTLIATQIWSTFAERTGLFDEVMAVEPGRLLRDHAYRRTVYRKIARRRFGVAINAIFSRCPWIDDFLVRATGAARRIGHTGDLSNAQSVVKRFTDRWYTRLVSDSETLVHDMEKNWAFARQFGATGGLRIPPLDAAMIERPAWLAGAGDYFVLFPGAASPIRRWPAERFAEIAARIHARTGWSCIICGGASDSTIAEDVMKRTGEIPMENACGRTSLSELAGVLADARFVITNDTGAAHMAASLGKPAAVILGGGHFGRFFPYPAEVDSPSGNLRIVHQPMSCYHCNWQCVYPRQPDEPGRCIGDIATDNVWKVVEEMLPQGDEIREGRHATS